MKPLSTMTYRCRLNMKYYLKYSDEMVVVWYIPKRETAGDFDILCNCTTEVSQFFDFGIVM